MKSVQQLRDLFEKAGVNMQEDKEHYSTLCTCGSGVTACLLRLALAVAGLETNVDIYDGSFAEWVCYVPVLCNN